MSVFDRRYVWVPPILVLLAACEGRDPLAPGLSLRVTGAAPTNLTASANSHSDISLAWEDNSINETGWEVYRSTTGATGTFTVFANYPWSNITAASNGGLQGSTEYCYKVRSYKKQGQQVSYSGFSNVACAITLATPVPPAPSGVSAVPDQWRVLVTWTDNAGNETGFRVDRAATSSGPWTSVETAGPNVVSLYDRQPPAAEQAACYRVVAFNSFGDSPSSNVPCTAIPNAPWSLVATATGSDVDLTWTDNSGVEDGFQLERWTASVGTRVIVATLPANTTAYRDVGLADDSYSYEVRAMKDGGSSFTSNAASATVVTMPPAAPSVVAATPASSSTVNVTWANSATAAGFRVERSIDGGTAWFPVGTTGTAETWFYDEGPASEQQVCYRVVALNDFGESPPSTMDCTVPPAGPTNLLAAGDVDGAIVLDWTDNSAVEDGYEVWRLFTYCDYYDGCYSYYEVIATLAPNTTSYRDAYWLIPGEINTYLVFALKDGGYSDASNAATVTVP